MKQDNLTVEQFNAKYKNFLEKNFYGLAISDKRVIEYLNAQFEMEIPVNKDFSYSQIKLKFGKCCVYANTDKAHIWEQEINNLLS